MMEYDVHIFVTNGNVYKSMFSLSCKDKILLILLYCDSILCYYGLLPVTRCCKCVRFALYFFHTVLLFINYVDQYDRFVCIMLYRFK